jgi:hypothetical protein
MMKKRKFGSGGMPSIRESAESAERVKKLNDAEGLRMGVGPKPKKKPMPATRSIRPSMKDIVAAGNRASKKDYEDMEAVKKYAKGGNVKRYADGDLAMSGAAVDLEAAARRGENLRELGRMNLSVPKIAAAKPKPKPAAAKPATSGMSDAEIRKFMSDNDRGADASARAAVKPAATKPAARQEPRVGLHNLGNVLKSTRKFGESIGFRSAPRPEAAKPAAAKPAAAKPAAAKPAAAKPAAAKPAAAKPAAAKPAAAKPAARQEPRVGLQNIGNPFAAMRKFGESIGFRSAPRPEAAKPAAAKPAAAKPAAAKPAAAKPAAAKPATRGMSDAQIRKFMSDNDRAADRSLAAKPATRGMSDAQIRKFMSDNDKAANRSLDDTKIRKYMQGLNADADRSLAAMKAKKEAKMASDIGKATTASLSAAASRAIPRTPGMPTKGASGKPVKPATRGMSDAEIRKFMRDNERGYEETAARKLANPISRTAKATGTAAKPRLVEPKYAKGGSVTRGDGIAKKGHTKGKIC